jgi:hypothetical protein
MGQLRRFSRAGIARLLEDNGFSVEWSRDLNKAAMPVWWLNSRVFQRQGLSKISLKLFDKTLFLMRLLDKLLPWQGLSLLLVARRK